MPKLSQNFLKSPDIARRIASHAELSDNDTVLEIGPGRGILTIQILKKAGMIFAVEKDSELVKKLKNKFAEEIEKNKLKLIEKDVLEIDIEKEIGERANYKLVANIPYKITGGILRKFLTAKNPPELAVLLVQKEVAENIARKNKESVLSLSIKAYGKPEYIQTIKKNCFSPAPKVDSAIIKIENIKEQKAIFFKEIAERDFFKIVKAGFSQPRKKLSSNLKRIAKKEKIEEIFNKSNIPLNSRAEDLDVEDWRELCREIIKNQ